MDEITLSKLKEYKTSIEGFLSFEKRALESFRELPRGTEQQVNSYIKWAEPIERTISTYETCLEELEKIFPELS